MSLLRCSSEIGRDGVLGQCDSLWMWREQPGRPCYLPTPPCVIFGPDIMHVPPGPCECASSVPPTLECERLPPSLSRAPLSSTTKVFTRWFYS
eukprot:345955-Rhodomonas_salina.1